MPVELAFVEARQMDREMDAQCKRDGEGLHLRIRKGVERNLKTSNPDTSVITFKGPVKWFYDGRATNYDDSAIPPGPGRPRGNTGNQASPGNQSSPGDARQTSQGSPSTGLHSRNISQTSGQVADDARSRAGSAVFE